MKRYLLIFLLPFSFIQFLTDSDGHFDIELPIGKDIQINYASKDHFSKLNKIKLTNESNTSDIFQSLKKMSMHRKENTNLEFIRGKSILMKESEPQLDAIFDMMDKHPNICLEIGGHVYARKEFVLSKDSEKFGLSIARSLEVYNYLSNRGIDESRMFARGYGNTQLLYPDAKTHAEANANRRVEIKIVDCDKASQIDNPILDNLTSYRTIEDFPMGRNYNKNNIETDLISIGDDMIRKINEQATKLIREKKDPTKFTYVQLFSMYRSEKYKYLKKDSPK